MTPLALIWWRHHLIWSGTIIRHSLSAPGASTLALCHRRKLSSSRNHQSSMWNQGCYLRPHEIIHSKHDGLWYRVDIRIVEVQDWNWPSDSSDDGTPLDNFISIVTKMNTLVLSRDVDQNHGRKEQGLMMALDLAAGAGWGPPFKSKDQTLQSRPGADCGARWSSVRCAVPGRTLPGLFWRCSLCRSNGMSIASATGVAASFWSLLAGAPPCSCGTPGSLCFGEP